MMTGRGEFLGTGSQIAAPARLPGSGKVSQASSSPWWWGGTEKGLAAHVAYRLGGARVGSRRTEAQEPLWVFPASCPVSRTESPRPQASLQMERAHLESLDSNIPVPPPAPENREICTHPHQAWEPMVWGVPLHAPPPMKKFHAGCFLPAFEEKTLCLKLPLLHKTGDLCFL